MPRSQGIELLRSGFSGLAPFVEVLTGATKVDGGEEETAPGVGTREEIIDRFHSTRGNLSAVAGSSVGRGISQWC